MSFINEIKEKAKKEIKNIILTESEDVRVLKGDKYGHMEVDLTGSGSGYYACGGKIIPIQWSKPDRNSPFTYTDESGQPIVLGRGSSYVNIIPNSETVTAE